MHHFLMPTPEDRLVDGKAESYEQQKENYGLRKRTACEIFRGYEKIMYVNSLFFII